MKTHKFHLYPSKQVEQKMLDALELCRQTYNILLGELNQQKIIDKAQIQGIIPDIKIADPAFQQLYSKTMQYECYRLFSNLQALAQSKAKRKVGALRFKGKGWFKTFTYNQSGFKLIVTGKRCQILHLSKIGSIPIRCHRNVKGKIKQVTVKREQSGKWFASIDEETENKKPLPRKEVSPENVVGIDVGLDNLVYDSDGRLTKNPCHLKKREAKLRHIQHKLSKKKKGSKNRNKMRILLARQHEKIANARNDFLHKFSHYYVENYDAIGMEDMPMTVKNDWFAKSKLDASWGKLRQYIAYKAASAGKLYITVDHRGTTQRCSQCGNKAQKELKDRMHECMMCGFIAPRDYNSALEIKRLALKAIGWGPPESSELCSDRARKFSISDTTPVEMPLTAELQCRSTSHASKKQEAPAF